MAAANVRATGHGRPRPRPTSNRPRTADPDRGPLPDGRAGATPAAAADESLSVHHTFSFVALPSSPSGRNTRITIRIANTIAPVHRSPT